MNKIIACRVEHCLGCRSCEMACAVEHSESKDIREAVVEHPRPERRVTVEVAGAHGLPLQCRHCEEGLCTLVCPTGAIHRDEKNGLTVVDEDLCIGCKLCVLMCPLGVLRIGGTTGRRSSATSASSGRRRANCPRASRPVRPTPCNSSSRGRRQGRAAPGGRLGRHELPAAGKAGKKAVAEGQPDVAETKAARASQRRRQGPARVVVVGSNAAGAMAAIHAAAGGAQVTILTADPVTYRRPAIPALIAGPHGRHLAGPDLLARDVQGIRRRRPGPGHGRRDGHREEDDHGPAPRPARPRRCRTMRRSWRWAAGVARRRSTGSDKHGVCTFTSLQGAEAIIKQAGKAKAAVVVGASFVALEVAQALLEKGLKVYFNVRSRILRRLLEPDVSEFLQDAVCPAGPGDADRRGDQRDRRRRRRWSTSSTRAGRSRPNWWSWGPAWRRTRSWRRRRASSWPSPARSPWTSSMQTSAAGRVRRRRLRRGARPQHRPVRVLGRRIDRRAGGGHRGHQRGGRRPEDRRVRAGPGRRDPRPPDLLHRPLDHDGQGSRPGGDGARPGLAGRGGPAARRGRGQAAGRTRRTASSGPRRWRTGTGRSTRGSCTRRW